MRESSGGLRVIPVISDRAEAHRSLYEDKDVRYRPCEVIIQFNQKAFWWPTLQQDGGMYVKLCQPCRNTGLVVPMTKSSIQVDCGLFHAFSMDFAG